MADFRCYAPRAAPGDETITLNPEETRHLIRVNRARPGAVVSLFDGRGNEWTGRLLADDTREAVLRVENHAVIPPPPCPVTLAQALPKGKTMDLIVRKATELGVAGIAPLVTARTEVRLDAARGETKTGKWEQAAVEAAKQSGNSHLPRIAPVQSLVEFLETASPGELRLAGSLHPGARHLKSILAGEMDAGRWPPPGACWLIGPEGDFTAEEMAAILAAGFHPVTMGRWVLRCETAAVSALSILGHELEAPWGNICDG